MKKIVILALATMLMVPAFAQTKKTTAKSKTPDKTAVAKSAGAEKALPKVYDEDRDPIEMLDIALEEARATNRLVIAQVGGNWCPWCLKLAQVVKTDEEIAPMVNENFVYVHINVAKEKEKRNYDLLKRLNNPGRFGYPVLVVFNQDGQVVHVQNSSYLEKGEGYDTKKVLEFFQNWTLKAIEEVK